MSNKEKSGKILGAQEGKVLVEEAKHPDTEKKGVVPPEIPLKPIEEPIQTDPGENQSGGSNSSS